MKSDLGLKFEIKRNIKEPFNIITIIDLFLLSSFSLNLKFC